MVERRIRKYYENTTRRWPDEFHLPLHIYRWVLIQVISVLQWVEIFHKFRVALSNSFPYFSHAKGYCGIFLNGYSFITNSTSSYERLKYTWGVSVIQMRRYVTPPKYFPSPIRFHNLTLLLENGNLSNVRDSSPSGVREYIKIIYAPLLSTWSWVAGANCLRDKVRVCELKFTRTKILTD